jgi:anaerobic selenocysteine-containing dehydrogenase
MARCAISNAISASSDLEPPRYRLHSQMDPGPVSAAGKVAGREAVAINPEDAKRRGITEVRVYNSRGSCLAGAVLTDAVRPGVLRLSCGAWYDPPYSHQLREGCDGGEEQAPSGRRETTSGRRATTKRISSRADVR